MIAIACPVEAKKINDKLVHLISPEMGCGVVQQSCMERGWTVQQVHCELNVMEFASHAKRHGESIKILERLPAVRFSFLH